MDAFSTLGFSERGFDWVMLQMGAKRSISSDEDELESLSDFIVKETPRKLLPMTREFDVANRIGSARESERKTTISLLSDSEEKSSNSLEKELERKSSNASEYEFDELSLEKFSSKKESHPTAQRSFALSSCIVIPSSPEPEANFPLQAMKRKRRLVKLQDLQESKSEEESEKDLELLQYLNNSTSLHELGELEEEILQKRPFSCIENVPSLELILPIVQESVELQKFKVISQKCQASFSLLPLFDLESKGEDKKNSSSQLVLKPHQIFGVSWMLNLYSNGLGGILADEMGLGKTVQVISFISHLISTATDEGPFLVICPSSVLSNWFNEFERWAPRLKVVRYHGSMDERFDLRDSISNSIVDVVLTTYSMATSTKEDKKFLKKLNASVMFVDEGHFLKNNSSQKYISIIAITAKQRILITGTPLQNDLMELFSLLQFITPSELGVDFELLQRLFSNCSGENSSNLCKIKSIIEPFVLRRKKCNVLHDMPQKNEKIIYCPMNEAQRKINAMLYEKNLNSLSYNVNIQLRKAACHPLLFRNEYSDEKLLTVCKKLVSELEYSSYGSSDELYTELWDSASDYEIHQMCKRYSKRLGSFCLPISSLFNCEKITAVFEIYQEALKEDSTSKFLIFSQFITVLDILEDVLEEKSISFCRLDGSTPVLTRQSMMDEFNSNSEIKVFLLSSKAAGFGINLCSANHVIMYDIDYNPQNDRQAEDRCHRIGQTKDVHVYKLITQGSVDEKALDIASGKIALDKQFH